MSETKKQTTIVELPVDIIDQFPKHPYKVKDDDDMIRLVESIRDSGVIIPIIVRAKKDGRYEMISGHRRLQACRYLGHKTIRSEVVDIDKNAATVMMVDSNLARSNILPSEKAFAYKMRLDAMKRQGKRTDLTSATVLQKSMTSREKLAAEVGESHEQIRKYNRLTNLIPMLLLLVDEGQIAMRPAVEISYLTEKQQEVLADCIAMEDCTPSHYQAIRMRKLMKEGNLTDEIIAEIMREQKPNQKDTYSFSKSRMQEYLPEDLPVGKREDYVIKALQYYGRYLKRQKGSER